jgi:hypothetical protein
MPTLISPSPESPDSTKQQITQKEERKGKQLDFT